LQYVLVLVLVSPNAASVMFIAIVPINDVCDTAYDDVDGSTCDIYFSASDVD
jgi:hypothetical protein